MRDGVRLIVEPSPNASDVARLDSGLSEHAAPHVPSAGFVPLAVFARDADDALCGGALGKLNWNWLHVSLLWVAPAHRRTGLGARLLARIESEARDRGCEHAHLDTFSYQARPFYEAAGYSCFATLENYPPGHSRHFMKKDL